MSVRDRLSAGCESVAARPVRQWSGFHLVLLAALLAFAWQSFVLQTHRHLAPATYAAGAEKADAGSQLKDRRSAPDLPVNCPFCQEIAHAGVYVMPTLVAFVAPQPAAFWVEAMPALRLMLQRRAHAWQSRAPPHSFQA